MLNSINLLAPSTSVRNRINNQSPSKILIGGCTFSILVLLGIYAGIAGLNWHVEEELSRVQAEIKIIQNVSEIEKRFNEVSTELQQTSTQIQLLKAQRPQFTAYLDELSRITPASIILTNLEIRNNPFEFTIKGNAPTQTEVANFGKNLQNSDVYKDSFIKISEKNASDKVYTFTVSITPKEKGGDN